MRDEACSIVIGAPEGNVLLLWHDDGTFLSLKSGIELPNALNGNVSKRVISVTLARTIAHDCLVSLPKMAPASVANVLGRDASRIVVGAKSVAHDASAAWLGENRYRAAFAPAALLETLEAVTEARGWRAMEVRTTDDVIAGAVAGLTPRVAKGADAIAIVSDMNGPREIVHIRNGTPVLGRRLLKNANEREVIQFIEAAVAGGGTGSAPTIVIFGPTTTGTTLAAAVGREGHRTRVVDVGTAPGASAEAIIATLARRSTALLPLKSRRAQENLSRTYRRITAVLLVASIVAAVTGLWLERLHVARQLADVDRQRADISADVRNAITRRSEVQQLNETIAALGKREGERVRATAVLTAVATALPAGTSLTALQLVGDTVSVEGESGRSGEVYDVLRKLSVLEGLRASAPVRQERGAGDVMIERFSFMARVRSE